MTALLEPPGPSQPPPEERERRRRRRAFWAVVAASLGFHALLALLAGAWIVSRAWHRPVVVFTAHRPAPALPAEEDGGQAGAGSETPGGAADTSAYVPPPPASEAVSGPLPQALPDLALPSISLDPSPPAPLAAAAVAAGSGSGAGMAAASGAGNGNAGEGSGDGLSFFGLQEEAHRVVIALDVSYSMFVRQPGAFDKIVAETARAIARLGPDASFDLIVFEDGSLAWKPALVPATDANLQQGADWLAMIARLGHHFSARGEAGAGHGTVLFEGGGTRGDTALRQAFSLRPDLIVLLTDGQWQENQLSGFQRIIGTPELTALTGELQKEQGADTPVRIDVVFLSTARTAPGENSAAQALAEGNGGHLVEIKGEDLVK